MRTIKPNGCKGSYKVISKDEFLSYPIRGECPYKDGMVFRIDKEVHTLNTLYPVLVCKEEQDKIYNRDDINEINIKLESRWVE